MDDIRRNLEDRFSDAALALLMDGFSEVDGQALWDQYQASEQTMPQDLDQRCQRQMQKTLARQQKKASWFRTRKLVSQTAASLVLVLLLTISLVTSVEALRVPVLNFLLKHSPRATTILFSEPPAQSQTQLEELVCILKSNVPKNYTLELENIYRDEYLDPPVITSVFLAFQDADENFLLIQVSPAEGARNIDTEGAAITQMTLVDQRAILVEKAPEIRILWINDTQGLVYDIYAGAMEKSDFLDYVTQLAEEIRYSNAGLIE